MVFEKEISLEIIAERPVQIELKNIAFDKYIKIPLGTSMDDAEQIIIDETLTSVENNKSKAARILGLSRKTLHNKLNDRRDRIC